VLESLGLGSIPKGEPQSPLFEKRRDLFSHVPEGIGSMIEGFSKGLELGQTMSSNPHHGDLWITGGWCHPPFSSSLILNAPEHPRIKRHVFTLCFSVSLDAPSVGTTLDSSPLYCFPFPLIFYRRFWPLIFTDFLLAE